MELIELRGFKETSNVEREENLQQLNYYKGEHGRIQSEYSRLQLKNDDLQ